MTLLGLFLAALAGVCHAETPPNLRDRLLRLAEEAEAFGQMAPEIIGQEHLEQVAAQPLPRFQIRGARREIPYKTRTIDSEYGFARFSSDGQNLHEVRQVLAVDGRQVKTPGKLRETLSMGLHTDTDKLKKKMLKEFESYGLREAATDFGQLILLFTKRQLDNYSFAPLSGRFLGPDKVMVVSFEQKDGDTAMTVFEGRQVVRHRLKGEVWLRETDGLPLRITLNFNQAEKNFTLVRNASVDYAPSAYGVLLPAALVYSESVAGHLLVENRFRYSNYKKFGASSELKFTVDDSLLNENPPKEKK